MLVCKASDRSLLDLYSGETIRDAIIKGDHVSINSYDSGEEPEGEPCARSEPVDQDPCF